MKVSLVLLVGLMTAASLRSRSAALRHWILAASIFCAGAVPLMERAAPSWIVNVAILPVADVSDRPNVAADITVVERGGRAASAPTRPAPSGYEYLAAIWFAGAALSLAVLGTGLVRLAWVTSRGRISSDRWRALAEAIRLERGLRRPVDVIETSHPSLLATWGIRPRIVVPAGASQWSDDLVRAILQHEIAHIRRGDWLIQMIGELLRAVYWFNPLVWLACSRLRTESEQACDDEVLAAGTEPAEYATHLLSLARHFSGRTWFPAPAMARRSTLHRRVTAMLNTRLNRTPPALMTRLAAIALMLAATYAVAAAQTSPTYSGTLYDPQGGVLPGVRVTLTSSEGAVQETHSNASGQFQFRGIGAGDYWLEAELAGFKSKKRKVSVADTGVMQSIVLELGSVRETINIVDSGGDVAAPVTREAAAPARPACGQPPANPDAVRVGGNIRMPVKLKDVRPVFPASMRGKEGDVVLDAVIGTDGFVHDIRVRKGEQAFADAFIAAVTEWRFDATLLNCVAVDTPIMITGQFR